MGRVGEKGGFPRLPFGKTWPDDRQIARIVDGAQDADALRALFRLLGEYRRCESANQSFQARLWGEADQSEYQSEHWNYVRNSDFTQGTNGDSRWTVPGGVSTGKVTTGLPKGARNALQVFHAFGVPKSLTQSASATGQTWYVVGGWVRPISGQYAGVMVTENSGSSTARTHAWRFRPGDGTPWYDLRSPLRQPLAFVTYKGTTKVTTALIVAANGQAMFSQMSVEKGRRAHPWRPHLLDRGNLITSIKTAGSASFYGNVTLSGAGSVRIRQTATRKFIVSGTAATLAGTTPNMVSVTGTVGVGTTAARADHVHRGVKFIRTAGSASFSGSVTFSGGGSVRIRQKATRTFVVSAAASVSLASTTPSKVSSAGTVGVGTTAARADHVHRGVTSIFKSAGASADGRVGVVGSGGATVQVLAGNLRVHAPAAGGAEAAANSRVRNIFFGG